MRHPMKRAVRGFLTARADALAPPGSSMNQFLCKQLDAAGRRLRHLSGRLEGLSYHLAGRHPDPDVIDDVLADRVRSSLGPLVRRLDVPHPRVMVDRHIVELYGVVGSEEDERKLVRAACDVSGVHGVDSYLHLGLGRGDSRPSDHGAQHSRAYLAVLDAARNAGIPQADAALVARRVLSTFSARLPESARAHITQHLPADVQVLFTPSRRTLAARPERTVHELVANVGLPADCVRSGDGAHVVAAVIGALRTLVPEDRVVVAASLPAELRELWLDARVPAGPETAEPRP